MNKSPLLLFLVFLVVSCGKWGPQAGNHLLPVKTGDNYGYIDRKGNVVIPFIYHKAGRFNGGVAIVASSDEGNKWGYIDKAGKYVLEPVYNYATSFSEGMAFVVREGGVPEAIDKNGVVKFSLPDAQSADIFNDGLAAVGILGPRGEVWGFVNKQGKQVIPAAYSAVSYFSEGKCAVMNSTGAWGYINKNGGVAIEYLFENGQPFFNGKAKVASRGKWGVIGTTGKFILPPAYTDLDVDGDLFLVKKQDKWGWINGSGDVVIPFQFTDAYPFKGNKYAPVKSGDKWGYIGVDGKFAIAPQYDFAFGFDDDVAVVELKQKCGFINDRGAFVVNPLYDRVPVDYYIHYFAPTTSFYSVKTDVNQPANVAYKWLTAFYHMDYEEADKYATEDTRLLLDQFAEISEMISDSSRRRMNSIIIGIKDCKINGNRAIVTYTLSDNKNKDQMLFLVKTGRQWLVQFSENDSEPNDTLEGS
jgi:hypothetical protein